MTLDKERDHVPEIDAEPEGVLRRSFLQYVGIAFAASTLPSVLTACASQPTENFNVDQQDLLPSMTFDVVRPDDLVTLTFRLVNMKRDTVSGNLVPINTALACYVMVDFPPQIIAETPLMPTPALQSDPPPAGYPPFTDPKLPQSHSKISGPSRLLFRLPSTFASADYSLASLLALCSSGSIVVPASAVGPSNLPPPPAPPPGVDTLNAIANGPIDRALASEDPVAGQRQLAKLVAPGASTTGGTYATNLGSGALGDKSTSWIEMPHRLLLAPNAHAVWGHATSPVQSATTQRVELWHSFMGVRDPITKRIDEHNGVFRTACAVGTRDDDAAVNDTTDVSDVDAAWPLASLTATQRRGIVNFTAGTSPVPIKLRRLMLSALGGYLDAHADFPDPTQKMLAWSHRIAQGREHAVEIVSDGFILPFGHRATLLQITKRNDDPNRQVGLLERYNVVIVRRAHVSYRDTDVQAATRTQLLSFPFAACEVRQTTFVVVPFPLNTTNGMLIDLASGKPISAPFTGYDRRGRQVKFEVPLYYVNGIPSSTNKASSQIANYPPVVVDMKGQRIAYAASSKDDTTFETKSLTLSLVAAPAELVDAVPQASNIDINVESIRQITGNGDSVVNYDSKYAQYGFDGVNNKGERLFTLVSPPTVSANFASNGGGSTGFVSPNMVYNGLSRKTGPINTNPPPPPSGPHAPLAPSGSPLDLGQFDPKQLFNNALDSTLGDAKLFGCVPLLDLIQHVVPGAINGAEDALDKALKDGLRYAPKMVTETYHEVEKILATVMDVKDKVVGLYEHSGNLGDLAGKVLASRMNEFDQSVRAQVQTYLTLAQTDLNNLQTAVRAVVNAADKVVGDIEKGNIVALTGLNPDLSSNATAPSPSDVQALLNAINGPGGLKFALTAFTMLPAVPPQVKQILNTAFSPIDTLVAEVNGALAAVSGYLSDARALVQKLAAVMQGLEMIRDMKVKLEWRPKIQNVDLLNLHVGYFQPAVENGLLLQVEIRGKANGNVSAGADVLCRLDRFALRVGADNPKDAWVSLTFDHFQFKMELGKKPDVDVVLHGIDFGGPLSFIQTLRQLIPLDGFSDPPYLNVTSTQVEAGFTLAVPNVAVGMFSLENIAVSAGLVVPFIGNDPLTFTFAFCDKDHPFLVTVAMLGGGGYFKLVTTPKGLQSIEAAIYAAASLALDLFVASGSVSISVGLSFLLVNDGNTTHVTLGGFLKLHGQLDVLGLITVSIDLSLELTYTEPGGCLVGKATLHIEVDVAFFSTSVTIPFERKFAGSNGDPTLVQMLNPYVDTNPWWSPGATQVTVDPWADYCAAYAAV